MATPLVNVNRRIDTRSNGLKFALLPWLSIFADFEMRRAIRDPYGYARMRETANPERVKKQRDEDLEYLDKHLRYLLLRYGLREAAETANRTAGRVIVPESLVRDAIDGKPVKIKWFWELRNGIAERVTDITDATRNEARESVKRIIRASREETREDGTPVQPSVGEIARRIRTAFQASTGARGIEAEREREHRVHAREDKREFIFSSERAALIARTELAQSENSGIYNGYAETGVEWVEWMARARHATSGKREHWRMNGVRVRIGEMFTTPLGNKMRHPGDVFAPIGETANCFPGDTMVVAERPEQIYRRWYEGEMVSVTTASGRVLSGTPNHPVLTSEGWVALGSINEGDNLIDGSLGNIGDATDTNPDLIPTSFAQAFDLSREVGARVLVGSNLDFHGDGREGDVEVITTKSDFFTRVASALRQRVDQKSLTAPLIDAAFLADHGSRAQLQISPFLPSNGIMSGLREPTSPVSPLPTHSNSGSSRSAANLNTGFFESTAHTGARDVESLRQRQLTLAIDVSRDDFCVRNIEATESSVQSAGVEMPRNSALADPETPTDLRDRNSFQVQPNRVVNKSVSEFRGHVYNLQTSDGWYLANGLVVHNCGCTIAPVVDTKSVR